MIDGSKSPNATKSFDLGITNVVKDCTPVSLNDPLVRRNIIPVSLDITQVNLNNAPVNLFTVRSKVKIVLNIIQGTGQNYYTRTGPTFRGRRGVSKTPPIFEHYQRHFIGF